ncbi:MAG TPA: SRPBCC family protein [Acidimicrobiales bacterium]|nr:SRPBCC family protein [Acidimicrobiales bacterium]
MRRECEAAVTIGAPPEAVWAVIANVTRIGEWSGECRRCAWVGAPGAAVVGARFRGSNRRGGMRWSRLSEIDVADPPRELAWHTIFGGISRDSTEWRLRLRPTADGTEVTLSFRIVRLSRPMALLLSLLQPAHRDRTGDLTDDLGRLKKVVEAGGAPS